MVSGSNSSWMVSGSNSSWMVSGSFIRFQVVPCFSKYIDVLIKKSGKATKCLDYIAAPLMRDEYFYIGRVIIITVFP